ncbi:MAG: hypothetical protein U1E76_20925 [Planctomycetota bacterium]
MRQFLREQSLGHVNLARIAWRMRERSFFTRAIEILEQRHVFEPTLWSYGSCTTPRAAVREFLEAPGRVWSRSAAPRSTASQQPIDPVAERGPTSSSTTGRW